MDYPMNAKEAEIMETIERCRGMLSLIPAAVQERLTAAKKSDEIEMVKKQELATKKYYECCIEVLTAKLEELKRGRIYTLDGLCDNTVHPSF